VRKRELSMKLRIVISVFAVCLGLGYAYQSGSTEAWALPVILAVLLGVGLFRLKRMSSETDNDDHTH